MVKNRTEQARQLGYENYVELGYYRMNRNCYDKEMVENFRKQVKEYFVPFANKLHEQRRQRIGVEKVSYIETDVYFTNGNPAPVGTPVPSSAFDGKNATHINASIKSLNLFMLCTKCYFFILISVTKIEKKRQVSVKKLNHSDNLILSFKL